MTPFGKVAATVFIIFGFVVTAGSGLMGNLLAMGGWLLATVFAVGMCINAADRAEQERTWGRVDEEARRAALLKELPEKIISDRIIGDWNKWHMEPIAEKGVGLLNVSDETDKWNRAALRFSRKQRRTK
jgi:hypothetical protein